MTGDVTTFTYENANRLLTAVEFFRHYNLHVRRKTAIRRRSRSRQRRSDNQHVGRRKPADSGGASVGRYHHVCVHGDGLRVLQDDGLTETRFVHDGNNVVLELDDVGTVEADFTYIPAAYDRCSVSIGSGIRILPV